MMLIFWYCDAIDTEVFAAKSRDQAMRLICDAHDDGLCAQLIKATRSGAEVIGESRHPCPKIMDRRCPLKAGVVVSEIADRL